MSASSSFDINCRHCPRLASFLDSVKEKHPEYYAKPVPSFGDPSARLLIVGLAPGLRGANASGRPFTGDHAGILLYQTIYDYGFSSAPESLSPADGLQLHDCRITNAVKCLPPANKPTTEEIRTCNPYLGNELSDMVSGSVVLALGAIAHNAILRALGLRQAQHRFGHAHETLLPGDLVLLDSYHCSRYNTQTRRLTPPMFQAVFARARAILDGANGRSV